MTVQKLRDLGYNKVADAAEKNWRQPEYASVWTFVWNWSPEGYEFWEHVHNSDFKEAFKICPHLKDDV